MNRLTRAELDELRSRAIDSSAALAGRYPGGRQAPHTSVRSDRLLALLDEVEVAREKAARLELVEEP